MHKIHLNDQAQDLLGTKQTYPQDGEEKNFQTQILSFKCSNK